MRLLLPVLLGLLAAGGVALLILGRRARRRRGEALLARLGPEGVLGATSGANSLGLASRGMAQLRGNGTLVLTREALVFEMLLPRRELRIPLVDVLAVDTTRSHVGKSVNAELLRVRFRGERGAEDAVALAVPDLARWRAGVEGAARAARARLEAAAVSGHDAPDDERHAHGGERQHDVEDGGGGGVRGG